MGNRRVVAPLGQSSDDAFSQLYVRYYQSICDFCRRRVDADAVDDTVAEVFLIAWRRLQDVPSGDEGLVWLYTVAYRVIGHEWRASARWRRLQSRARSVAPRPSCPADESITDDDETRLVLRAAARLRRTDAEVLRLAAWEQLGIAELAAVLGISGNAAKQRLHRAKRNLADEYRRLAAAPNPYGHIPEGGSP